VPVKANQQEWYLMVVYTQTLYRAIIDRLADELRWYAVIQWQWPWCENETLKPGQMNQKTDMSAMLDT